MSGGAPDGADGLGGREGSGAVGVIHAPRGVSAIRHIGAGCYGLVIAQQRPLGEQVCLGERSLAGDDRRSLPRLLSKTFQ